MQGVQLRQWPGNMGNCWVLQSEEERGGEGCCSPPGNLVSSRTKTEKDIIEAVAYKATETMVCHVGETARTLVTSEQGYECYHFLSAVAGLLFM